MLKKWKVMTVNECGKTLSKLSIVKKKRLKKEAKDQHFEWIISANDSMTHTLVLFLYISHSYIYCVCIFKLWPKWTFISSPCLTAVCHLIFERLSLDHRTHWNCSADAWHSTLQCTFCVLALLLRETLLRWQALFTGPFDHRGVGSVTVISL